MEHTRAATPEIDGQRQKWQKDWCSKVFAAFHGLARVKFFKVLTGKRRTKPQQDTVRSGFPDIRWDFFLLWPSPGAVQNQHWVQRVRIFPSYPFPPFPLQAAGEVEGGREGVRRGWRRWRSSSCQQQHQSASVGMCIALAPHQPKDTSNKQNGSRGWRHFFPQISVPNVNIRCRLFGFAPRRHVCSTIGCWAARTENKQTL